MQRSQPGYGRGSVELDASDVPPDESELPAKLLSAFHSPNYRPPSLPDVAIKLLELSRRNDVALSDVTRLIERDAFLVGKVIQVANSPMYGRKSEARSLHEAVTGLGLSNVRDVVWEASTYGKVIKGKAYVQLLGEIGEHSRRVGHFARIVCRATAVDAEYAFLCGLLHEVGASALLAVAGENRELSQRGSPTEYLDAVVSAHGEAAAAIARFWELPAEIAFVLRNHHYVRMQGHSHPMTCALILAEGLEAEIAGSPPPDSTWASAQAESSRAFSEATKALSVSAMVLDNIRKECAKFLTA